MLVSSQHHGVLLAKRGRPGIVQLVDSDLLPLATISKLVLAPQSDANPKNTEGSGVVLRDGRVLLLWTQFLDIAALPLAERPADSPLRRSAWTDDGYARIVGAESKDGGLTWSTSRVVADDADALVNTMSPALTRLADGRLLLAYSWRSGGNHADNYGPCARRVRISADEGATWSEPVQITPVDGTYHTGCHDRAWTLPSGRVLVQCHTNTPLPAGEGDRRYRKTVYLAYSDDAGKTWAQTGRLTEPVSVGLNESCLARRGDGSLLMVLRSWRGRAFVSESIDEGSTWSEPRPSGVTAPDAPTYITRVPDSDDQLMIWNNTVNPRPRHALRVPADDDGPARVARLPAHSVTRCPLFCAISRDGGRTWGLPRALELDINYEWAYPGVVWMGDYALVHYFRSPAITRGRSLVVARVPRAWFYGEDER